MHILGIYVHMCTKYGVSMSDFAAGKAVHKQRRQHQQRRRTKHDCTRIGSLVDLPNKPKTPHRRSKMKRNPSDMKERMSWIIIKEMLFGAILIR